MEESANGDEKVPKAENVQDAPCQDARVYSFFLNDNSREKMIECHLWVVGVCGTKVPTLAFLRFFTPNPFSRNGNWTFINVHF